MEVREEGIEVQEEAACPALSFLKKVSYQIAKLYNFIHSYKFQIKLLVNLMFC